MYIRYPLSLRQVEDILFGRGIDICHKTVRFWWNRFGPMFVREIRKRRVHHRSFSHWRWHLDEVFVRVNGDTLTPAQLGNAELTAQTIQHDADFLLRGILLAGHPADVLDKPLRRRFSGSGFLSHLHSLAVAMSRKSSVIQYPQSVSQALTGDTQRQETGRWLNNRAENSHRPFRRRERAMAKFRSAKSLQKFASIHYSVHNHFNQERHLHSRENFKLNRSTALAEWRQLAA